MSNTPITPQKIDFDAAPVALVQLNKDRKIESLNTPAEVLLDVSRQAAIGKSLTEASRINASIDVLIDRSVSTGGYVNDPLFQLRAPTISGPTTQHTCVHVTADKKIVLAFLPNPSEDGAGRDIYALGNFTSILGHEVKNPLAGLSGAAQLLLRNAREDQKELLGLILSESERITRLVDELSAFELFSSPNPSACNIHAILDNVLRSEELAFQGAVRFNRNFDPSLPDIYADADHVHEVFQNLIRNAHEALSTDAQQADKIISISTRFSLDRKSATPGKSGDARFVKVSIEDNGPGIRPEVKDKIFEVFHSNKPNGGGLGLTIAKQIIKAHDGFITFHSEPGKTVFSVFLPVASMPS